MKGEYVEDEDETHNHSSRNPHNIFPKFHSPNPNPNSFPLTSKDSDEADSDPSTKKPKTTTAGGSEDGSTIEVSRRSRGRPPGSKNKPKPKPKPIPSIARELEPPMAAYILEVPGGSDIIESLTRFTRRRALGLCVLTASGTVTNVKLKQPSTAASGETVTFHGRFDILSLSAVLLLNTVPFGGNNNPNHGGFAFTISLAGPQGQMFGGQVVGPLLTSGSVHVMAASFNSPSFHRLSSHDQEARDPASPGGRGGDDGRSISPVSCGGLWDSTARLPHHH